MTSARRRPVAALLRLLFVGALLAGCTAAADDGLATPAPRPRAAPSAMESEPASPVDGGTAIVALTDEPTTLAPWMAGPDSAAGPIVRSVLAPLWRVRPDGTAEPWLLAQEPTVRAATATTPFTVVYRIRDDAVWSDGMTIDGRDVLFTFEMCQRQVRRRQAPNGDCAAVDLARSSAVGKRATVAFERPVADWSAVLGSLPVLPEHRLRDRDPPTAWERALPVGSGPFEFVSWTPDERVVLRRNEGWWGDHAALERIEFRVGDVTVDDVARGAVGVAQVVASPSTVEQARADTRVRSVVAPGPRWAALDMNLASPLLERRAVRRALVAAIDRATIVEEVLMPIDPNATVLDAPPGLAATDDADQPRWPAYDPAAARQQLDALGCVVGRKDIRRCGDEPLRLDLAADVDDWQQTVLADYVRRHLAAVGVEVRVVEAPHPDGADVRSEGAGPSDDASTAALRWDLRIAFVDTRVDPRRWHCDEPANTQSFCNRRYDAAIERLSTTTDPQQQAALGSDAARVLASDVPTYPLYQIPIVLLRSRDVRGPVPNAGPWGLTWNVDAWSRTTNEGSGTRNS